MNNLLPYLIMLTATWLFAGCKSQKQSATVQNVEMTQVAATPIIGGGSGGSGGSAAVSSPLVLVYKTRADYNHLVPVIMNDDKTRILSYPHPRDVKQGNSYAYPTQLTKGYLLDNRGIGRNVVFLTYTYKEYAALTSAPSISDLLEHIADKNPLMEMYECGRRAQYDDIEKELNDIIATGFAGCKCIVEN